MPSHLRIAEEAVTKGAMQKPKELARMLDLLADSEASTVLEIGGMHGGTAWAWWQVLQPPKRIVTIDLFVLEGRMKHAPRDVTLINADSHDPATLEHPALQGLLVNFLFIDGDHSYRGVRQDFAMYANLVRPGGLIALHDVSVEQPARVRAIHDVIPFWNELCRVYPGHEIFDPADHEDGEDRSWGGIGVIHTLQDPMLAAQAYGMVMSSKPEPADWIGTVPLNEPCGRCGAHLTDGEQDICRSCA
jgi:predicted O-methyltransferase YrrM